MKTARLSEIARQVTLAAVAVSCAMVSLIGCAIDEDEVHARTVARAREDSISCESKSAAPPEFSRATEVVTITLARVCRLPFYPVLLAAGHDLDGIVPLEYSGR